MSTDEQARLYVDMAVFENDPRDILDIIAKQKAFDYDFCMEYLRNQWGIESSDYSYLIPRGSYDNGAQ